MRKQKTKREWALWRCKAATKSIKNLMLTDSSSVRELRGVIYDMAEVIGDLAEALGADDKTKGESI